MFLITVNIQLSLLQESVFRLKLEYKSVEQAFISHVSLSQTSVEHKARHFTTNLQSHRYRMKRAEVLKVKIRAGM